MKKFLVSVLGGFIAALGWFALQNSTAFAGGSAGCPNPSGYQLNPGTFIDLGNGTGKATICSPDGVNVQLSGDAGWTGNLTVANLTLIPDAGGNYGSISYFGGGQPEGIFGVGSVTFSNATKLGGYGLPGLGAQAGDTPRSFTFTAMTGAMSTASAGTGSVTITLTDGTNTCTFTGTCAGVPPTTGFAGTGAYRIIATAGSGTGCSYPPGAGVTGSVTASNCGTTTPIGFATFEGKWQ